MNTQLSQSKYGSTALIFSGVRALYWIVGSLIIAVAAVSLVTQMSVMEIMSLVNRHFGVTFITFYTALVVIGLFAVRQLWQRQSTYGYWHELCLQTANGISTLALTFTLFGISMGISSLSPNPAIALSPLYLIRRSPPHSPPHSPYPREYQYLGDREFRKLPSFWLVKRYFRL